MFAYMVCSNSDHMKYRYELDFNMKKRVQYIKYLIKCAYFKMHEKHKQSLQKFISGKIMLVLPDCSTCVVQPPT